MQNFTHLLPLPALIAVVLILISSPVISSSEYDSVIRFKYIDNEALEAIGEVLSIAQDKSGIMWFGGSAGLARFDGYDIKVFVNSTQDKNTISGNDVRDVLVDEHGNIWAVTARGGLNKYDIETQSFTRYLHDPENKNSLSSNELRSIAESQNGNFWIATEGGGLNTFNPATGKAQRYTQQENNHGSYISNNLNAVIEDSQGRVWVGTAHDGLLRFNPTDATFKPYRKDETNPHSISGNSISTIFIDDQQRFWVVTREGGLDLFLPDQEKFYNFQTMIRRNNRSPEKLPEVHRMSNDSTGNLWITTSSYELIKVALSNDYTLTYSSRMKLNNLVRDIFTDQAGDWWFGLFPYGVMRYDNYATALYYHSHSQLNKNSISNDSILAIEEDRYGDLWVGTENGLNRINRSEDTVERYLHNQEHQSGLKAPPVLSLLEDSLGILWVGTFNGGIQQLDRTSGSFKDFALPSEETPHLPTSIWAIFEDSHRTLWVGTDYNGLYRFNRLTDTFENVYTQLSPTEKELSRWVSALHEDSNGNFWVGTNFGLFKLDRSRLTLEQVPLLKKIGDFRKDDRVLNIHEDSRGDLWIASSGNGVYRRTKNGNITRYSIDHGLSNSYVTSILEDKYSHIWLGTGYGLSRFNPSTEEFTNYDKSHGLKSTVFNRPAKEKTRDGMLFFGSTNGLVSFDVDEVFTNNLIPETVFTSFSLFNREVELGDEDSPLKKSIDKTSSLTLTHSQSVFTIGFAAINYRLPEHNQYAYMMEGFEASWNYVGNQRSATYTNLDPGEYRFKVKSANNEGLWNETPRHLDIVILAPWWRTYWAYSAYAFVFFIAVFVYLQSHRKKLATERNINSKLLIAEQELEKKVKDRTRELYKSKKEAEVASKAKSLFLANISHEIRTPMNAVLGYAQLLKRDKRLPPDQVECVDAIEASGEHLMTLINDVLDISKIEAGEMKLNKQDFDLVELCDDVSKMFSRRCESKGISWAMKTNLDEEVWVKGDRSKLSQVLINLVSNAIKFTDEGEVEFIVEKKTNSNFFFKVSDTGAGIPEEDQQLIFNNFHQAELGVTKGGSGLGLTIASQNLNLMGSQLQFTSIEAKGSTFYFSLSLSKASNVTNRQHYSEEVIFDEDQNSRRKILVVDDVEENSRLLAKILSQAGFEVLQEKNGEDAVSLLAQAGLTGLPDLVFLDIKMPDMDGFETLAALNNRFGTKTPPCIAVTASALNQSHSKYINKGFSGLVLKPFKIDTIHQYLKEILDVDVQSINKDRGIGSIKYDVIKEKIDSELLKELIEAAQDFEIEKLKNIIEHLKELGPEENALADVLSQALRNYDRESILMYLEKIQA